MDPLTTFGLFAVTAMLVFYALEDRSPWYILGFAVACALGSAYGFPQGAWPFGVIEAVWASGRRAALANQNEGLVVLAYKMPRHLTRPTSVRFLGTPRGLGLVTAPLRRPSCSSIISAGRSHWSARASLRSLPSVWAYA
jgi:hypothetical protein